MIRLVRFACIGLLATGVHFCILLAFIQVGFSVWLANPLGFCLAFVVSFWLQQRYAFRDRLAHARLTSGAGAIIFFSNLLMSSLAGVAGRQWLFLLPFIPPVINYILYYWMSGSQQFRRVLP